MKMSRDNSALAGAEDDSESTRISSVTPQRYLNDEALDAIKNDEANELLRGNSALVSVDIIIKISAYSLLGCSSFASLG